MSKMYSSCTVCYEQLSEDEKRINTEKENFNFPVCRKCLDEAVSEIEKTLKK